MTTRVLQRPIEPTSYEYETSIGNVAARTGFDVFGANRDVDTAGTETAWSAGGLYVRPSAAETLLVSSLSSADTAQGTGARTLRIFGLDGAYNTIDETITLNGTSDVETINSYIAVNRAYVETAGSGRNNAGNITIKQSSSDLILRFIQVGIGQTEALLYMCPANAKCVITRIFVCTQKTSGGSPLVNFQLIRKTEAVDRVFFEAYVDTAVSNHAVVDFQAQAPLLAGEQYEMQVTTDKDNTNVFARMGIYQGLA